MKKSLFYTIFITIWCIITSCETTNIDNITNNGNITDNTNDSVIYSIHLCTEWGMSIEQVKAEMEGYTLDIQTEDILYFSIDNASHIISYEFINGELCTALAMIAEEIVPDSLILQFVAGYTEVGFIGNTMVYLNESKNTIATYSTETDNKINYKTLGLTRLDLETPQNIFYYTTTNNRVLTPNISNPFDVSILSNTYRDGVGMIVCDGDITSIKATAFEGCKYIKSVILPNSVVSIEEEAFYNCKALTSINIPENVTTIEEFAFRQCEALTSIVLPPGITSIKERTFDGCLKLANVNIPDNVTTIGDYAFCKCEALTNVTIPESVTSIGHRAFGTCVNLTSINIPEGFTSIEDLVFSRCYSLTNIKIPDNVTSIGMSAFLECKSLTSVTIPDKVNSIGGSAFRDCGLLKEVYCKPTVPPAIYYDETSSTILGSFPLNKGMKIYVPRASYNTYTQYTSFLENETAQTNWSKYKSYIQPYDF